MFQRVIFPLILEFWAVNTYYSVMPHQIWCYIKYTIYLVERILFAMITRMNNIFNNATNHHSSSCASLTHLKIEISWEKYLLEKSLWYSSYQTVFFHNISLPMLIINFHWDFATLYRNLKSLWGKTTTTFSHVFRLFLPTNQPKTKGKEWERM